MYTFNLKYIIPILFSGIFFSCNQQQADDESNSENIEIVENNEENNSEIDSLEQRMDNLMNENNFVEGETHKDVSIIKAGGAKSVEVKLKIGAGKLRLSSGSSELLTGGFIFNNTDWKPEVTYKVQDNKGYLTVKQPDSDNFEIGDDNKYAWNLKFTENLPLDFDIELGAGLSEIFLNDLQISRFRMNMGVGKTEIDFNGKWKQSTDVYLDGGIGLSVIHLPKNVGVLLNISKGLGSVDVQNMIKNSNTEYVNETYEKSNIKIRVYLKTGIGKIEVD